jgi:hypothetical protein
VDNDTPLFIVGNGWDTNDRTNALLVRKDGRIGIGTNVPQEHVHIYDQGNAGIKVESVEADAFISLENLNDDWEMRLDQSEAKELDWRYNGNTKMALSSDGRLAIGSNDRATGYHLSVGGKIIAEELRCQLKIDWPDYVFDANYPLLSLHDLEKSIQTNGHLPGIPSATEIKGHGVDVGDMQVRMMEKIEELTLYMIELNKQNKVLVDRIADLEESIKTAN